MAKVYELVTALHNARGNFFSNVFKYELSESGSTDPFHYAAALIDAWISAIETDYLDTMGTDVILDFLAAKRINSGGGPSASRIRNSGGSGAAESISAGLCLDVQLQHAGSSNRPGHLYIGALPDGALVGDTFDATFLGGIAPFLTDLHGTLTLAGTLGTAKPIVYSRKTDTANDITVVQTRPKATMMNRRLLPQI